MANSPYPALAVAEAAQTIAAAARDQARLLPHESSGGKTLALRVNAAGNIERTELDKTGYEHHWQRPDGSVYAVDSSD